ncbi:hypothetical protein ACE6H2_020345 [Prunus campanulata]
MKKAWQSKGVSICSDRCLDAQRRPLINILVVCETGPIFLKTINCEVVTDNALICKAVGHIVEAKYKHIFSTLCVVHTLNALKNRCSPVLRNLEVLSMYNAHCKLKLLSVVEARFASSIAILKRFKQVKQGLEQMVISEQWDMYKDDDVVKARMVKEKILDECF